MSTLTHLSTSGYYTGIAYQFKWLGEVEMVHYQKVWVLVLLGSWPFGSAYWVLSIATPKILIDSKILVLSPSPRYWVLLYLSSESKVLDYSGQCSAWKLFDLHCTV